MRTKVENNNQYLYEKDIEQIKYFTETIKEQSQYAYAIELNSKEYLDLYYHFKSHLEVNINLLRSYKRIAQEE